MLYASTIDKSLWSEGEKTARAIAQVFKEKNLVSSNLKVLDVPCGMGRVAIPLARLGMNVTGVDVSPEYIRIARRRAKSARIQDKTGFLMGRAEELRKFITEATDPRERFDAAISIHTSLGYGTQRQDEAFLRQVRSSVKDGGLFVITARRNKSNIAKQVPETYFQETDRMILLQKHRYLNSRSRLETNWRFYRKERKRASNGERGLHDHLVLVGKFDTRVRLYSTIELTALLEKTGWKVIECSESIHSRKTVISEESPEIYFLSTAA